jgi:hypothetical protein
MSASAILSFNDACMLSESVGFLNHSCHRGFTLAGLPSDQAIDAVAARPREDEPDENHHVQNFREI